MPMAYVLLNTEIGVEGAELGVPEDQQVYAALIFGYPKGKLKVPQKRAPVIFKRID